MALEFILNDADIALDRVAPEDMLLDFLRLDRTLCGTKEGCAEGDCGACTVLCGQPTEGGVHYQPLNACIRPLASLHGTHIVTVEHLKTQHGGLSPLQSAMVEHHGSQCGFCTPGIVMSLTAHGLNDGANDEGSLRTALDGNLCRCTGYRPILAAAQSVDTSAADPLTSGAPQMAQRLGALQAHERIALTKDGHSAIRPKSLDDLLDCLSETPGARLVAGATDIGLWITKDLRDISPAIFIDHLPELKTITQENGGLQIGACVTYAQAEGAMLSRFPHLSEYWQRFAGPQIRATGTIGGNIANGSPIGDMPPALIALGASITLRRKSGKRTLPLERFFIEYGKQDLRDGELLESILIPSQASGARHAAYKLSKRQREDISAVAACIRITVANEIITDARLAFGGMAGTPQLARNAQAALEGAPWSETAFEAAANALADDFTPLDDWRASAAYRMRAAQNLLRRFWLEHSV